MKLAILFALLPASSFAAKVEVPVSIQRFAYAGEQFMYREDRAQKILDQLLQAGNLTFQTFEPEGRITPQALDGGSKTRIGRETYVLKFATPAELHRFAANSPENPAPYEMGFSAISYGLLVGLRDYAIASHDRELARILLARKKSKAYLGSANEHKADLYAPLEVPRAERK